MLQRLLHKLYDKYRLYKNLVVIMEASILTYIHNTLLYMSIYDNMPCARLQGKYDVLKPWYVYCLDIVLLVLLF